MNRVILGVILFLPGMLMAATPSYSTSTRMLNPSNLIYFVDYAVATNNLTASNVFDRANVKWWGAKGDSRKVIDGRIVTGGSNVFSLTANFTSADLNKKLWAVETASGLARMPLGTITNVVNSTNVIVNTNATTTASDLHTVFGTDDSDAIRSAVQWATNAEPSGAVYLPAGGYVFSKLLVRDVGASFHDSISFVGEGSGQTQLFPSPAYDFTTTDVIYSMLVAVAQVTHLRLEGFTVDTSYYTFSNSLVMLGATAYRSAIEDVKVLYHKQSGGIQISGNHWKISKCWVEACSQGIMLNQCGADVEDSYFGNCFTSGVRIYGIFGFLNEGYFANFFGGLLDENTGDSVVIENQSTDVNFFGTTIWSTHGAYAVKINGECSARFVGCQITPYALIAGHNKGGIQVLSNATAYLTSNRLQGWGNYYAISNAGTIFDGGGNNIMGTTNAITNAASGVVQSFNFATNATFAGAITVTNAATHIGAVTNRQLTVATNMLNGGWLDVVGKQTNRADVTFTPASSFDIIGIRDLQAGRNIGWNGLSQMQSPGNGQIVMFNNGGTDFTRLDFGGSTAAFPSLKRSGTALHVRTAADGNFAPMTVSNLTVSTVTIFSGSGTPESAVTAPVGSLFLRTDGGAGTTLYVKESGAGNTGWVGK